ncbi:hypothetical protein I317_03775 [Kwoniella heveanensis CBS 569]|nr:hypothetical protein I317_03775 [Kwoniella heveanensis CBS 569]
MSVDYIVELDDLHRPTSNSGTHASPGSGQRAIVFLFDRPLISGEPSSNSSRDPYHHYSEDGGTASETSRLTRPHTTHLPDPPEGAFLTADGQSSSLPPSVWDSSRVTISTPSTSDDQDQFDRDIRDFHEAGYVRTAYLSASPPQLAQGVAAEDIESRRLSSAAQSLAVEDVTQPELNLTAGARLEDIEATTDPAGAEYRARMARRRRRWKEYATIAVVVSVVTGSILTPNLMWYYDELNKSHTDMEEGNNGGGGGNDVGTRPINGTSGHPPHPTDNGEGDGCYAWEPC